MRHDLKIVASNFRLDAKQLTEFALLPENYNRFGIIDNKGYVTTSTLFTDELVKAFRKQHKNV